MKIEVTRNDINNGVPHEENCCAIALAIKRQVKCQSVTVEDANGWITIDDDSYGAIDADAVNRFISDFDDGQEVSPFTLELVKWS
jgi:hypothetical protein